MLKNFIVVSARRLLRDRIYAAINIGGLALGLACCIIIALYLRHELSYDQHNTRHDQIFRLVSVSSEGGGLALTSQALAPLLARDNPEVLSYARFHPIPQLLLNNGETRFYEYNVMQADPSVFEMFTHTILAGDPSTVLKEPLTMAVSQSFAQRYFGAENPLGKVLSSEGGFQYRITHLFADLPDNTHLKYDALVSWLQVLPTDDSLLRRSLLFGAEYSYLMMPKGYDPARFDQVSAAFKERYLKGVSPTFDAVRNRYVLQPLATTHFEPGFARDQPVGNRYYTYAFTVIGLFALFVAAANYMNLATARSIGRAREVGLRKVLGSQRRELVMQFMVESTFLALLALPVALSMVEIVLTLTPLNQLLNANLQLDFADLDLMALCLGGALLIGLLSGIYPAMYLSSIRPIEGLQGAHQSGPANRLVRQSLVAVQFAVSICTVIGVALILQQMKYIQALDLGYEPARTLIIPIRQSSPVQRVPGLREQLEANPQVVDTAVTASAPGTYFVANLLIRPRLATVQNPRGEQEQVNMNSMLVGPTYLDFMKHRLVAGRNFDETRPADLTTAVLVNEALVKSLGWSEPLGRRIQTDFNLIGNPRVDGVVIGVVKDFHFDSLHNSIEPLIIAQTGLPGAVLVRYTGSVQTLLPALQAAWREFDPRNLFVYQDFEESLGQWYAEDQRQMRLIALFSLICTLVSCLGLYGLIAYVTERRTKEIGIRRVLGATTTEIVGLFTRNTAALILISFCLAAPLAYLAFDSWRTSFAYQAPVSLLVFVTVLFAAQVLALLTVLYHSIRAARANPVHALRHV